MRVLLAATMAASVLAVGSGMEPAASLPLGGLASDAGAPIHRVQQKDKGTTPPGPGMKSPGARGPDDGGRMRPDRGRRDDGPRMGQRSRDWDGDRDRRRSGRGGIWFGPGGFGFRADCGWLRRRALDTGSPYWWRQYRACMR